MCKSAEGVDLSSGPCPECTECLHQEARKITRLVREIKKKSKTRKCDIELVFHPDTAKKVDSIGKAVRLAAMRAETC